MTFIPCTERGREISNTANACPHFGMIGQPSGKGIGIFLLVLCLIIFVWAGRASR
jgi:hypothetical protein